MFFPIFSGGGDSKMATTQDWFNEIPLLTKGYLVGSFLSAIFISLGYVDASLLSLDFGMIWGKLHIWRLFTCFGIYRSDNINFLLSVYLFLRYSTSYETNPFRTGGTSETADYAFMIIFGSVIFLLCGHHLHSRFLNAPLLFMILAVWSRKHESEGITLLGFRTLANYVPWAFMAIHYMLGNSIADALIGSIVGFLYVFLVEKLPKLTAPGRGEEGPRFIQTPEFVSGWFQNTRYSSSFTPSGERVMYERPSSHTSHRWGGGHTLGDESSSRTPSQ